MMTKIYADRLKKNAFRMAVLSLITVLIWLVMATQRALTRSQVKPDVKKQLEPLTTSLPLDTIDQINQRLIVPPVDWQSLGRAEVVLVVPNPEAATAAGALATASGQINTNQTDETDF